MVGYAPLVWPAVVVRCVLVRIVETWPETGPEVTLAASVPLPPVFRGGAALVAAYVLCGAAGGGTLVRGGAVAGGGVGCGWPVPKAGLVLCPVAGRCVGVFGGS